MSIAFDPAPQGDDAAPSFPPLLRGESLPLGVDPFVKAVAAAASPEGVPAGTIFWSDRDDVLDAAIALAPEAPLGEAMAMVLAAANGLGDALGALAPPEVGVTWDWPDAVKVNGAKAGAFRADAGGRILEAEPGWLVIGVTLQIAPFGHADPGREPGQTPDLTSLYDEGCADLTRRRLLESWSRHMLVWINRWLDDGFRPIHDAWVGRVERRGETIDFRFAGEHRTGVFLGLDERGGMLLKTPEQTIALGLDGMLDHPRRWPDDR